MGTITTRTESLTRQLSDLYNEMFSDDASKETILRLAEATATVYGWGREERKPRIQEMLWAMGLAIAKPHGLTQNLFLAFAWCENTWGCIPACARDPAWQPPT